jgi:hypothetical protein
MIIAQLLGGLGNQMFQYAAGRSLAERHRTTLILDTRALNRTPAGNTPRAFALDRFRIRARVGSAAELSGIAALRRAGLIQPVREGADPAQADLSAVGRTAWLEGYWQSERHFRDIADRLREEFTLPALSTEGARLREQILACQAVSVHIRRGDYITNPAAHQFHGVLPLTYYQQAAAALALDEAHFFVFSDEPEWVRAHVTLPGVLTVVDIRSDQQPHEDLMLMSQCRHHIVANSSFSWWGAWLCQHPGRQVIAPRTWFAGEPERAADLVPAAWRRL